MLEPRSTTLVLNPAARGGQLGPLWEKIVGPLRVILGEVKVVRTKKAGDAVRLTKEAIANGDKTILSFGGDGTHNEVLNGIMESKVGPGRVTLGLLPGGTGGDLNRLLPCTRDVMDTAQHLVDAKSARVDVGQVSWTDEEGNPQSRFFLNIASFGMGGLVDRYVNEGSKQLGGKASFFLGAVRAYLTYHAPRVRLSVNGAILGDYDITNVFACNGRYNGGGMMWGPQAKLADGQLDIAIVKKAGMFRIATMMPKVYKGTYLRSSVAIMRRGHTLKAEPLDEHKAWLDIDGECGGALPCEIKLHPKALSLIGPSADVL